MLPATEQQIATLAALRNTFLASQTPQPGGAVLEAAQTLAEVALLIALPQPRSSQEAEEQITALQSSSLRPYAAAHTTWAIPVMERVQRSIPDPATVADRQPRGAAWTPHAWRAYVALLLGSQ